MEAKATTLRFAQDIVQWVERLVSQSWDSLSDYRHVCDDELIALKIVHRKYGRRYLRIGGSKDTASTC